MNCFNKNLPIYNAILNRYGIDSMYYVGNLMETSNFKDWKGDESLPLFVMEDNEVVIYNNKGDKWNLKEITQKEQENFQEAESWFKNKFPNVEFSVIQGLVNSNAFGHLNRQGQVIISDLASKGTVYHEAFHVVSQMTLNEKERQKLYTEVRQKDGQKYSDLEAEEKLAEDFREYMLAEDKGHSIFDKIIKFLKWLFVGDNIDSICSKIKNKTFNISSHAISNSFDSRFNDLIVEYEDGTEKEYSYPPEDTHLFMESYHTLFMEKMLYMGILDAFDRTEIFTYYKIAESVKAQLNNNILDKYEQTSDPSKKERFEKFYQLLYNPNNISFDATGEAEGKIRDFHQKYLKKMQISFEESEMKKEKQRQEALEEDIEINEENTGGKGSAFQESIFSDSKNRIPRAVKILLSTLKTGERNELGSPIYADYNEVANRIGQALSNMPNDLTEMIWKMKRDLSDQPWFYSLINQLERSTYEIPFNFNDNIIRTSFASHFSLARYNMTFLTLKGKGAVESEIVNQSADTKVELLLSEYASNYLYKTSNLKEDENINLPAYNVFYTPIPSDFEMLGITLPAVLVKEHNRLMERKKAEEQGSSLSPLNYPILNQDAFNALTKIQEIFTRITEVIPRDNTKNGKVIKKGLNFKSVNIYNKAEQYTTGEYNIYSELKNIAREIVPFSKHAVNHTVNTFDSKKAYALTLNNFLSQRVAMLNHVVEKGTYKEDNGVTTYQMEPNVALREKKRLDLLKLKIPDIYYNPMFMTVDENGKVTYRNHSLESAMKYGTKYEVDLMQGVKRGAEGVTFSDINETDLLRASMDLVMNGYIPFPRAANRSLEFMMKMTWNDNINNLGRLPEDELDLDDLEFASRYKLHQARDTWFEEALKGELEYKTKANFASHKTKFKGILETIDEQYTDSNFKNRTPKEKFKMFLEDSVDNLQQKLIEKKVITQAGGETTLSMNGAFLTDDGGEASQIRPLLKMLVHINFVMKYESALIAGINSMELSDTKAFFKRLSIPTSSKTMPRSDEKLYLELNYLVKIGELSESWHKKRYFRTHRGVKSTDPTFSKFAKIKIYKEPETDSDESLINTIAEMFEKVVNANIKDPEQKAKNKAIIKAKVEGAYKGMKLSDAQGYMSYDAYRHFKLEHGNWTKQDENLFQDVEYHYRSKKPLPLRILRKIQGSFTGIASQKPQYIGSINADKTNEMQRMGNLKTSAMIHIPIWGEAAKSPLKAKLDRLFITEGYAFYGSSEAMKFPDFSNYETKTEDGQTTLDAVIDWGLFGEQQVQSGDYKGKIIAGTQPNKIAWTNFHSEDTNNSSGRTQDYNRFNNAKEEIIRRGWNDVKEALGLFENGDDFTIADKDALFQTIYNDIAEDKDLSDNARISLLKMKELGYKIDLLAVKDKLESAITGMVDKKIIKEKRSGEKLAQVSAVDYFKDIDYLKFYRTTPKGKFLPAEVAIPLPEKLIRYAEALAERINKRDGLKKEEDLKDPLEAINEEIASILDMVEKDQEGSLTEEQKEFLKIITTVGYRIPSQLTSSSSVVRIKEFLHPINKYIVLFKEIVAVSGSDFDIDSFNIYLNNVHITKDGIIMSMTKASQETLQEEYWGENKKKVKKLLKKVKIDVDKLSSGPETLDLSDPDSYIQELSAIMPEEKAFVNNIKSQIEDAINPKQEDKNDKRTTEEKAKDIVQNVANKIYNMEYNKTKKQILDGEYKSLGSPKPLSYYQNEILEVFVARMLSDDFKVYNFLPTDDFFISKNEDLQTEIKKADTMTKSQVLNLEVNARKKIDYVNSTLGVGQIAVFITALQNAQREGWFIKISDVFKNYSNDIFKGTAFEIFESIIQKDNYGTPIIKFDKAKDLTGMLIMDNLSCMMSGNIGAIKDPFVLYMNGSLITNEVICTMLMMGIPFTNVIKIMRSDVIKKILNREEKLTSLYRNETPSSFNRNSGYIEYVSVLYALKQEFNNESNPTTRLIAKTFFELKSLAQTLKDKISINSPDTKGIGKSINSLQILLDKKSNIQNSKTVPSHINSLVEYQKKTMKGIGCIFITQSEEYKQILDNIKIQMTQNKNDRFEKERVRQAVDNGFINFILVEGLKKQYNSTEEKLNVFVTGVIARDLVKKLIDLKKEYPNNYFLKHLIVDEEVKLPKKYDKDENLIWDSQVYGNRFRMNDQGEDVEYEDKVVNGLEELRAINVDVYNKIVITSIAQGGINPGFTNITKYIPEDTYFDILSKGYAVLKTMNNEPDKVKRKIEIQFETIKRIFNFNPNLFNGMEANNDFPYSKYKINVPSNNKNKRKQITYILVERSFSEQVKDKKNSDTIKYVLKMHNASYPSIFNFQEEEQHVKNLYGVEKMDIHNINSIIQGIHKIKIIPKGIGKDSF